MQIELLRKKIYNLLKRYGQDSTTSLANVLRHPLTPRPRTGRESAVNSLGREALSEVGKFLFA